MAWDHALKMQTAHNIYLFIKCFSNKCAIYIVELEAMKASAGRGVLLSLRQNVAVATPPVKNKRKTQKPITLIHCE
jgi:hypothetical protein